MVTQRGRAKSSSCTGNSYSTRRRMLPQHGAASKSTQLTGSTVRSVVPRHALSQLPGLRRVRVGAVEQDDIGLAQRFQFGARPAFPPLA